MSGSTLQVSTTHSLVSTTKDAQEEQSTPTDLTTNDNNKITSTYENYPLSTLPSEATSIYLKKNKYFKISNISAALHALENDFYNCYAAR